MNKIMKSIKIAVIFAFFVVILIPMLSFNFESGSVSEIDNRMLTENPFYAEEPADWEELTGNIEDYLSDRIGFRDDMILSYTVLNDKAFGKMVHPSYTYGKDGYVFGAGVWTSENTYTEFHEAFADMAKSIQDYCEERDVPFLLVFEPAKPAVLTEYISDGINYERTWADEFLAALDAREVNYLDNTVTLREKYEEGIEVFNQKYDANHWNDTGAYYGTKAILERMKEDIDTVHVISEDEITISYETQESLLVSEFPIDEEVPSISLNSSDVVDLTELFDEIETDESYNKFGYYVNEERIAEGSPKTLVFQGSYLNNYGFKYLESALGEYIYIHDYQNILNFDYYYNIFKPDYVIFEVGEYTLSDTYFDYEKMCDFSLNPTLESVYSNAEDNEISRINVSDIDISAEQGETLTKLTWLTEDNYENVWMRMGDEEYDLLRTEQGWTATVLTSEYLDYGESAEIIAYAM